MKYKHLLLCCAGVAASLSAGSACAQTDEPATEAAAEESDEGLESIVVTAQRRAEDVQRAAVSITALGPEAIKEGSVTQVASLTALVPGLQATRQGFNTSLFVRGIGTTQGAAIFDPAIAFNLNGVYISRTGAVNGQFFDLERVEVLKGPQGTLYGRNASGGAINVITRRPELDGEISGNFGAEFGSYDRRMLNGAINLPLGASTAIRAAGQLIERDGYFDDGSDDESSRSFRLSLRSELAPSVTASLIGSYVHVGGRGPGAALLPLGTTPVRGGLGDPAVTALFANSPLNFFLPAFLQPAIRPLPQDQIFVDIDVVNVTGELEWTLPLGTLTVVPAYQKMDQRVLSTSSSFWFNDETHQEQSSIEARLASRQDQPLTWLVGAYYLHDENNYHQETDTQFLGVPQQIGNPKNETVAAFGQLGYALTESFRVTGSARYTWEEKSLVGVQDRLYLTPAASRVVPNPIALIPGPAPTPDLSLDVSRSWSNVTWKAGFEWDPGDRSLVFANISTGFKAGGFFFASTNNSYEPETVTAYTLGTKNRFLDNRLQVNAEVFYLDYKDQQLAFVSTIDAGGIPVPGFATRNVGATTIKGANIDLTFLATPDTRLTFQAEYLDSTYDHFVYRTPDTSPLLGVPGGTVAPQTGCPFTLSGPDYVVDCSGRRTIQAPEWVIQGGIEQTVHLGDGARIVAGVRSRYESERWTSTNQLPGMLAGGNTRTDASLSYRSAGDVWSITAYVNNIENDDVPDLSYPNASYPLFPVITATLRPPRIFGVRFNVNY